MSPSNQRSQSDLYQSLLENGWTNEYSSTVMEALQRHNRQINLEKSHAEYSSWCLLRFHRDGVLHSVHLSTDCSEDSEVDLAQLLTDGEDYDFQVMVYLWGADSLIRGDDVQALNKAWKIPDYLWVNMLNRRRQQYWSTGDYPEQFGMMSTQTRSLSVYGNRLYVPEAGSGDLKSGTFFYLAQYDAHKKQQ